MRRILVLLAALLVSAPALGQSIQTPAGQILGNSTATQRPAQASTVTSILDRAMGATAGSIMVRGASAWQISPIINIGCGVACAAGSNQNFNVYPAFPGAVISGNGVQLGSGTGNTFGEGGSVTFWTRNSTGSGAPIINQELGFEQAYAWNGVNAYWPSGAPAATVYITTEAYDLTHAGTGILFQAVTRNQITARGEACIAEGLTVAFMSGLCATGLGIGTINSSNGTYDNANRVLSASNTTLAINQNALTSLTVTNSSTGTSGSAGFTAANSANAVQFGVGGTGDTALGSSVQNKAFIYSTTGASGIVFYADGASHPISAITNGTEVWRSLLGFSVGTTSDPGAGMIYTNAATFMMRTKTSYANGAAAATATLTNAPVATNPTKWIPVDDNGTTRYIPAW